MTALRWLDNLHQQLAAPAEADILNALNYFVAANAYITIADDGRYLRPGVREALRPGETVVGGTGHAEANIIAWTEANGHRVRLVGLDVRTVRPVWR